MWSLILLERKIIFHSRDIDVITSILEAVRALIFPLSYSGIYIPMCASHILEMLLLSPIPYCIGMASEGVDRIDIPDDTWVVDIDNDSIGLYANGTKETGFGIDHLPETIYNTFVSGLRKTLQECNVFRDGVADVSNVFQSSQLAAMAADRNVDSFKVRDLALRCMIDLLFNYDQFLIINDHFNSQDLFSNEKNRIGLEAVFRLNDFIASKPSSYSTFLKSLGETQCFAYMMNERTYPGLNDLSFVFFDHCSSMLRKEMTLHFSVACSVQIYFACSC